jgi:hypothetical protein
MQDRYTADVGDYLKLGILRALSQGYRLGVVWWLYPDENHNGDGRHIGYLTQPDQWRHFDPDLFDSLSQIVKSAQRHVRALQTSGILPGAVFASDMIPTGGPAMQRRQARHKWFQAARHTVQEADLVFVDPDNGLEPDGFGHGSGKAGKSITFDELRELVKPGRCLIVYHHHTRRAGGHYAEIEYLANRLRKSGFARVDALRARPYSPRVFFLLDAPADVCQRAEQIAWNWRGLITWHPDGGRSSSAPGHAPTPDGVDVSPTPPVDPQETIDLLSPEQSRRRTNGGTTQIGYINQNQQEVVRPTGRPGTDHG